MFVLVCPFDLSFESVDVPHVFIEIRAGQWVLLSVISEGVGSVLLNVLFVREGRAMRWAGTLPLHLCQSFEVVITRVKAEFSFVVLEFVRVIEVEVTLKAGVIYGEDMLTEIALVKLSWVLGHTKDKEKIKEMMLTPFAREINPRTDLNSVVRSE